MTVKQATMTVAATLDRPPLRHKVCPRTHTSPGLTLASSHRIIKAYANVTAARFMHRKKQETMPIDCEELATLCFTSIVSKCPSQTTLSPQPRPAKIQPIHQRHNSQANKCQRRHRPCRAQIRKHDDPNMRKRGRKYKTRDEECRDRTRRVIRIRVSDIRQHALIQ